MLKLGIYYHQKTSLRKQKDKQHLRDHLQHVCTTKLISNEI
jgi:hypothetical protein